MLNSLHFLWLRSRCNKGQPEATLKWHAMGVATLKAVHSPTEVSANIYLNVSNTRARVLPNIYEDDSWPTFHHGETSIITILSEVGHDNEKQDVHPESKVSLNDA